MSTIDIVFDGPPGPESGRFVEVENAEGHSIKFGEWVKRADGYWVFRIEQHSLPVAGYTAQSDAKVALVNEFKVDEERLLRKLDALSKPATKQVLAPVQSGTNGVVWKPVEGVDLRWLAITQTHFQEGFMALNRAVFQPQRISLPENDPTVNEALNRMGLP